MFLKIFKNIETPSKTLKIFKNMVKNIAGRQKHFNVSAKTRQMFLKHLKNIFHTHTTCVCVCVCVCLAGVYVWLCVPELCAAALRWLLCGLRVLPAEEGGGKV